MGINAALHLSDYSLLDHAGSSPEYVPKSFDELFWVEIDFQSSRLVHFLKFPENDILHLGTIRVERAPKIVKKELRPFIRFT